MKHMKKIITLLLAAVMVLAMSSVASAATGDYQIKVDNTGKPEMSINGKTFSAYKVFNLTLGAEDTSTDPATYGAYAYSIKNNHWAYATLTKDATTDAKGVITTKYGIVLTPSASDPTTYSVDGEGMTDANARALADALKPVLPTTGDGQAVGSDEIATINLDEAGWYAVYGAVKPTDPKAETDEVIAAVGLTTTDKKVTVNPKASVPTLNKKITGVTEDGQVLDTAGQAAVAKVGAKVSYQLDSKTPDLTGYTDYTFKISDKISTGLTYDDTSLSSLKVKINGTEVAAAKYTLAVNGQEFTLTIPFDTLDDYAAGTPIVVTYDAVVNSSALTTDYEKNTANLEYSHSPYDTTTNKTPDKETYVIDLNIDVVKIGNNDTAKKLAGAEFKLYRTATGGAKQYYKWADNKVTWVDTQAAGDTFTTDSNGKLTQQVRGLDKGEYYLEETKAPEGYNVLAAPVKVTISVNEADNKVTYSASTDGKSASVTNGVVDLKAAQNQNQPVATATINNESGTELPETGGIGTVIFYVLGSLLVVGCGIILVSRRRMNANK